MSGRYENVDGHRVWVESPAPSPFCEWCGTALFPDFEQNWHDRHGDFACPASDDGKHDPGNVPAGSETPSTAPSTAPDQQTRPGTLDDFPGFDVYPGYAMHADSVALHFPLTAVPALAELFPTEAEKLRAAALDVEQEAEYQQAGAHR